MKDQILLVDYGMGNLRSVEKAFERCGASVRVSDKPRDLERAEKIVLPGVGAFSQAMSELKRLGLAPALKKKIKAGTPYLGLCLGLQILFEKSEEGTAAGLGIFPGKVRRFKKGLKVPHMGWNTLSLRKKNCPLLRGMKPEEYFYFVHSFFAQPEESGLVAAETQYGRNFCSVIWDGNVFATQFHPEKSQAAGLRLVQNFTAYQP